MDGCVSNGDYSNYTNNSKYSNTSNHTYNINKSSDSSHSSDNRNNNHHLGLDFGSKLVRKARPRTCLVDKLRPEQEPKRMVFVYHF